MNKNRKTLKMPVRYLMNAVLVVLLFLALSYMTGNMLSTYQNKVLMTVGINIILAVSLNVATGYLGQLPLGHAGFMAVGAYTCALFTKYSNLPSGVAFVVGLVLACIVAGLFGVLIGIPALRIISLSFLLAGFDIIIISVMQALGHGVISLIISMMRQLVVLLPAAFLFSKIWGLGAVWIAFPLAECVSLCVTLLFWRKVYRNEIQPLYNAER